MISRSAKRIDTFQSSITKSLDEVLQALIMSGKAIVFIEYNDSSVLASKTILLSEISLRLEATERTYQLQSPVNLFGLEKLTSS